MGRPVALKVLFVMRSVAHFSYHESTIRALCAQGHAVHAVFDSRYSVGASDRAARDCAGETPGLSLGWSLRRSDAWRRPLLATRGLLSYSSHLRRKGQPEFFRRRWVNYFPSAALRYVLGSRPARMVLSTGLAAAALRVFERVAPPDRSIGRDIEGGDYDVVAASPTTMPYFDEAEYLKAAGALGVPTVLPVLSWDNLTNKGVIHVVPDLTLAWNSQHVEEAGSIHRVPAGRTVITGSPLMDRWYESPAGMPEAAFRGLVGLPEGRPFVLYLGSTDRDARDESSLMLGLAEALRGSSDPKVREALLLVRPHPGNQAAYRGLSAPNVRLWLREEGLPDTRGTLAEFRASIEHAVCVVGLNTTGMVDAVLADRPVIALLVEEYRRTTLDRPHFRRIVEANVFQTAETVEECAGLVGSIMHGADPRRGDRRRFAAESIRPHGLERRAGDLAALAIEMAAEGKPASAITRAIASAPAAEALPVR